MSSSDDEPVVARKTPVAGPSRSRSKRAASSANEPEQEEEQVTPKGKKRVRTQENESESEDEEEHEPVKARSSDRDANGYCMGSILRITCHNFQTYDDVTVHPGPALNMILGPNGTGKSTLASAMAIGLGFPPSVLDKGSNLGNFCKDGAPKAWVEIELRGQQGERNHVVRCDITSESKRGVFKINGKAAKEKDVHRLTRALSVQVNNLCSFLPQDRVAHFAQLKPPALLIETQKAAGDPRLIEWQRSLIQDHETEKILQKKIESAAENLKRRQEKQTEAEKSIKQFDARQKLLHDIGVCNLLIQFAKYNAARADWNNSKARRNELQNEVLQLEAANKPFKDSEEALEGVVAHFEKQRNKVDHVKVKKARDVNDRQRAIDSCVKAGEKSEISLKKLKDDDRARRKELERAQIAYAKEQKVVDNKPETYDATEITEQIRGKVSERAAIDEHLGTNIETVDEFKRQLKANEDSLMREQAKLKQLLNTQYQREAACKQWDSRAYVALQWMRRHKENFKGQVCEPARLCVNAKSKQLATLAEGPISAAAMGTFVFELQEDYDYMMQEVNDKGLEWEAGKGKTSVGCNGAHIGDGQANWDYYRKPRSDAELARLGFDCHAIDLIDGPPLMLMWLCKGQNLHKIPMATKRNNVDTQAVVDAGITRYYTKEFSVSVKTSDYGNREKMIDSRTFKQAKILNVGADLAATDLTKQAINELKSRRNEIADEAAEAFKVDDELHAQRKALLAEISQLNEEKKEGLNPMQIWRGACAKLDVKKAALERAQKSVSNEGARTRIKNEMKSGMAERVKQTLAYCKSAIESAEIAVKSSQLSLKLLQAQTDLRAMNTSSEEKDRELGEKRQAAEDCRVETARLNHVAKQWLQAQDAARQAADEEVDAEAMETLKNAEPNLEELEGEVKAMELNLETTAAISPAILRAFEERKKEIKEYGEKLQAAEGEHEETKQKLADTLAQYLPKLEELISVISKRYSEAFDKLGLLGEIEIGKEEDYAKWGIVIKVAFRDGQAPQALNAQTQSGGERAVATMMYLLSLAELVNAPFTLVDEINQGMDAKFERQVHNALVETVCTKDIGQYFLITPKLLSNLNYHPRMKILTVHNGAWLPDAAVSLADLVKNKLKRNRG